MQQRFIGLFARSLAADLGLPGKLSPLAPPGPFLSNGQRWGRRLQRGIADTMIKTEPVDAQAAPSRIAVAKLDSPNGRLVFLDVFERPLLGALMVADAALLPLAVKADVEGARVCDRRRASRRRGQSCCGKYEQKEKRRHQPRMAPTALRRNYAGQAFERNPGFDT